MQAQVPASLYFPDTADSVIARMHAGYMPAPFIRRMRLVNLISAVVLRKIEPELLLPFDAEDLHHVLDRQISQDAVIDQLNSKAVAAALTTGDLSLLEATSGGNPLLAYGLASGWIKKFFNQPFDPLCIMLAMRSKLLLDAIDEMGHSYNLIRMIGFGWIDFGDVPGEEPGNPGDYYPPALDNPIVTPPAGGGPGPGAPGYAPPGPGEPGYVPPGPGPGAPGYAPPGPVQMINVPGGSGGQLGGPLGSMAAPSGFLDQGIFTGKAGGGGGAPPALNCCLDKDNPSLYVTIYPLSMSMDCGDTQTFMVKQYNPVCAGSHYTWFVLPDAGTLVQTGDYQVDYTAPDGGEECPPAVAILLYCGGVLVDSVTVTFNTCPAGASIGHSTHQMAVDEEQELTAVPTLPGCGTPTYDWEITAGGGSLSSPTGAAVTYTAPASNAECANNPTITLSCGGVLLDTLNIAIAGWYAGRLVTAGSWCCDFTQGPYHQSCVRQFQCGGTWVVQQDPICLEKCDWPEGARFIDNVCTTPGGPFDERDPAWITAGCCPWQLL